MPNPVVRRRMFGGKLYLLEDRFGSVVPAGSVNGTRSTSGALRTVLDTGNTLAVSGGQLRATQTAAYDPALGYTAVVRRPGTVLYFRINIGTSRHDFGWASSLPLSNLTRVDVFDDIYTGNISIINSAGSVVAVGAGVANTWQKFWIVLRAAGAFWFAEGGVYVSPTLLFVDAGGTANLIPATCCMGIAGLSLIDDILIPAQLWLPSPIASDSFTRGDGALGTCDGLHYPEGGAGKAWQFDSGVWAIATNVAVGAADATVSKQFATINAGTVNTFTSAKLAACAAGKVGGVVVRLDDPANPLNLVKAVFDGSGNVVITEVVAGTPATLATVAKAFTASDTLTLSMSGTAYRCYHTTSAGVAVLIASGTTNVVTGTYCGLHATDSGPTFNGFGCLATGNEGQYTVLDQLGA